MKLSKTTNLFIHNLWLSKYTYEKITHYPKILSLSFSAILHYKQKNKYFLFITIIMLFMFFKPYIKTRFFF